MAALNKRTVTLSSGFELPVIGFGKSFSTGDDPPDPVEIEDAVEIGLQTGYRHLDCAPVHENEIAVGKGILASGIPRKQIYVTSKLWNTEHDPRGVEPALDRTLRDPGVEFVDLYLVHWPDSWVKLDPYRWCPGDEKGEPITSDTSIAETWAAMEELVEKGKARSIGDPAGVDQTASNPYRPKRESLEFCRSGNIHFTAWGPLTANRAERLNVSTDEKLIEVAKAVGITPAQLALSWALQRGV